MLTLKLCALLLTVLQPDKPPADPPKGGVEEAIAAALRNHPDVRVAEANRVLADAELEQTKLAVSKRVTAAYAKLEAAKLKYEARAMAEQMTRNAGVAKAEILQSIAASADAKAELVVADEEVKSAVGAAKVPAPGSQVESLAAALKGHPDIKVAEAKRLVADATLEQAKLAVIQRVAPAFARLQTARVKVQAAEEDLQRVAALARKNMVPKAESDRVEAAVQTAKAELVAAEAELKAVTGGGAKANPTAATTSRVVDFLNATPTAKVVPPVPSGSAADKLREVLDKKVKLPEQKEVRFKAAVDALKAATGIDLTVRLPTADSFTELGFSLPAGEMTFTAWTDLMLDEFNANRKGKYAFYIREYGLLLTAADSAPPGALTLAEFARLVRAEKEKGEPKR